MTAVQWLVKYLSERGYIQAPSFGHSIIDKAINQAKAMEKEQIENAYLTCHKEYTAYGKHWEMGMDEKETFEEYFEQKYGGKNGK